MCACLLIDRAQQLIFASVIALSISGCALYLEGKDLSRRSGLTSQPVAAVLVGSVTNPDPHIGSHADIRFFFRQVNGKEHFHVRTAPHAGWLSGPDRSSDPGLENLAGKLFSVSAAPGEYELVRVNIWQQFSRDVKFNPRPMFRLEPGEVVYIGNLVVTNCYSLYIAPNGERRRATIAGGFVSIRDDGVRDIPALRATFPHLRDAAFIERIIDNDALVAGGTDKLSQRCTYESF